MLAQARSTAVSLLLSMTLWGLASSSLLLASARSFVLPPSLPQQALPSLATAALTRGRAVFGPLPPRRAPHAARSRLDSAAEEIGELGDDVVSGQEVPRRSRGDGVDADGEGAPLGDLDALDDLLGLHKSAASGQGTGADGGVGNLDALDDLLRRDAGMTQASPLPIGADESEGGGPLPDDGFGALDDLLGLEEGPRLQATTPQSPPTVGDVDGGGSPVVDIDPYAKFDAPPTTDSLDDLLSQSIPSAPKSAPAAPAFGVDDISSTGWLDDLLKLENDDLEGPADAAAGGGGVTSRVAGGKRSRSTNAALESLIDEVSKVPGDGSDGGDSGDRGDTTAVGKPVDSEIGSSSDSTRIPVPEDMAATAPAAIDDWMNDLLEENEAAGKSAQPGASSEMSPPWPSSSLDTDPWDFDGGAPARPASGRGGGGYDDVITGSNQLEGWKSNMEMPRSNVMGRAGAGRGSGAAPGGSERSGRGTQSSFGESGGRGGRGGRSGEAEFSRSSDWGAGAAWEDDGGLDDEWGTAGGAGGRRFDDTETAQRAVTADLKSLGKRGEWEDALRALVGARVRGIPVNQFMYNSAISAVAKCGRYKEALSMMEQMRKDDIEFDVYTYSGAITACGKGGQARKALSLLDEMVKKYGLTPDMVCYGAAAQACADAGLSEEASGIMRRMNADEFVPDKAVYNSAITACGQNGEWEKALDILGEMRAAGLRPDQHSYRFAMKACGSGGRWERALQLLSDMEEDSLTPEIPAFQAALDTLREAGQWEKALELISEMDELGVAPTEECFAAAIAACAEVGQWRAACDAVKTMRDLNLQPSVSTYNSVLKACVRGKNYSRALTTMNDMRVSGKRPEQESWELLVEACTVCGRWECAVEVVRDMFAEEVYYDMEAIRTRLFECPVEDIRKEGLLIIAMEARSAVSMKRKKQNNIRMAAKIKAKYMPADSKAAPRRKRAGKRSDGGVPSFADRNNE